jgi:hypothetical protein
MRRVLAGAVLAAFLCLTACSGSLHVTGPNADATAGGAGGAAPAAASIPRAGRTQAELDVVAGFTTVAVTVAPIGDRLLEVGGASATTPPAAILAGDTVAILTSHPGAGGSASDTARIVLNPNVRWHIALSGGAATVTVNLSGGSVSAIDVTQGISSLEVIVPAQAGTTAVELAAGVSLLRVHTRGNEPARATLAGGAGNVVIDGVVHSGVAAGSSFASAGWDAATNRVDVECSAGVSSLIVDQI